MIVAAFLLDAVLGDPPGWPHPVRWIARVAHHLEMTLRRQFSDAFFAGALTTALTVLGSFGLAGGAVSLLDRWHPWAGTAAEVYLLYAALSLRGLHDESKPVMDSLNKGNIPMARQCLSRIVGRDTAGLDPAGIRRATVETIAENYVDGVLAPLFYSFLGGTPLAWAYKAINTLDSMFGYKNERYLLFGRFPAKLDDAANWIPARLSVLFLAGAALMGGLNGRRAWSIALRDGRNHSSPNAGFPEAAVAGALGVRLGGTSSYGGFANAKPFIGDALRDIEDRDIQHSHRILIGASCMALFVFFMIFQSGRVFMAS